MENKSEYEFQTVEQQTADSIENHDEEDSASVSEIYLSLIYRLLIVSSMLVIQGHFELTD